MAALTRDTRNPPTDPSQPLKQRHTTEPFRRGSRRSPRRRNRARERKATRRKHAGEHPHETGRANEPENPKEATPSLKTLQMPPTSRRDRRMAELMTKLRTLGQPRGTAVGAQGLRRSFRCAAFSRRPTDISRGGAAGRLLGSGFLSVLLRSGGHYRAPLGAVAGWK